MDPGQGAGRPEWRGEARMATGNRVNYRMLRTQVGAGGPGGSDLRVVVRGSPCAVRRALFAAPREVFLAAPRRNRYFAARDPE